MKKRATSVLLALCMVLTLMPAGVLAAGEGDFTIEDGVLTKYNGSGGDVTIPDGVISVGYGAFRGCTGLTKLTISSSVTSIGNYAFEDCSGLASVNIPNGVTNIGNYAFEDCSGLTSVTIPNSVTDIGDYAFKGCTGLPVVKVPGSVTEMGSGIFSNCTNLSNVTLENGITAVPGFSGCTKLTSIQIPDSVTSIEASAFRNCTRLIRVNIPDNVISIGYEAFQNCTGLTSVTVPDSVTSIGNYAFYGCTGLTSMTIPNNVTSIGYQAFYSCTGLTSLTIGNSVTSIGTNAFYKCTGLTNLTIPGSVTTMDTYAFCACTGLTDVVIEKGVTAIGVGAFADCSSLARITIPNSVTTISKEAFRGCTSLTSITIPGSAISIGDSTFKNCTALTDAIIENGVTTIGYEMFLGCTGLTSLTIPDSVTGIFNRAFLGCTGLTNVTIPDSITTIGGYAFSDCTSLTNVTLGNGITSISERVFKGCSVLSSITIPDSVTNIGAEAFQNCYALATATFGNGVTTIGQSAFRDCYELSSAPISDNVTVIGENVFLGSGLEQVNIPASVTQIGDKAFQWCRSLRSFTVDEENAVYSAEDGVLFSKDKSELVAYPGGRTGAYVIPSDVLSIADYGFGGCTGLTYVEIPDNVRFLGKSAFYGCSRLANVVIGNGITEIPAGGSSISSSGTKPGLFAECYNLSGVSLPSSVTAIRSYGFSGCSGLANFVIPDTVKVMEAYAFNGCTGLTHVTIGSGITEVKGGTFDRCSGLKSITIPLSVKKMGERTFYLTVNVKDIYYGGDESDWAAMDKDSWNDRILQTATRHYNSSGPIPLRSDMFEIDLCDEPYTGYSIRKSISGSDGEEYMSGYSDYTAVYANNYNIGTATVTLVGKGKYTGTLSYSFQIVEGETPPEPPITPDPQPIALTESMFTVDSAEETYTGTAITKSIVGKDGGKDLTEGTDYTVFFQNNTNAGIATITIIGKGNYTGTVTKTFTIIPAPISGLVTAVLSDDKNSDGKADVGDVVTARTGTLPDGADLTYRWYNGDVAIPDATEQTYTVKEGDTSLGVTVTASGNYSGSLTSPVMEVGKRILSDADFEVDMAGDKVGDTITIKTKYDLMDIIITWYRDGVVIEGTNGLSYTITDQDLGKNITYQILPKDPDSYTGGVNSETGIWVPPGKPDKPTGSASNGNGTITITWTAPASNGAPITGYIIYLENGERIELGPDATSYTFTGLTGGTTYSIVILAVNAVGESAELRLQGTTSGGGGSSGNGGGGGSWGGSSSGSSTGKKAVSTPKVSNGSVSLSTKSAKEGDTVTVTVTPDKGYQLEKLVIVDKKGKTVSFIETGEGKYTFTMPATEVTVTPTFAQELTVTETPPVETPPEAKPSVPVTEVFGDVRTGDWFREATQYVYDKGMMSGLTQNTFGPDTRTSRAMIVTILYRLEGKPDVSDNGFSDIASGKYYSNAVSWASANGIVTGFEDATFRPDGAVTREQLAVILYRYANITGKDVTITADISTFKDMDTISAWAADAMKWAVGTGLLQGMGSNELNPSGSAIRAQVATIMMRYCENVAK